jgi:hypothetical protein
MVIAADRIHAAIAHRDHDNEADDPAGPVVELDDLDDDALDDESDA